MCYVHTTIDFDVFLKLSLCLLFCLVCRGQLGALCTASRILLQFLLNRLQNHSTTEPAAPNTLTAKQLLLPIRALCSASSALSRTDQIALTAIMKNAKLPPHIKTSMPGECWCFSKTALIYLSEVLNVRNHCPSSKSHIEVISSLVIRLVQLMHVQTLLYWKMFKFDNFQRLCNNYELGELTVVWYNTPRQINVVICSTFPFPHNHNQQSYWHAIDRIYW